MENQNELGTKKERKRKQQMKWYYAKEENRKNKNARDNEYIKHKYKNDPEFREKVINASKKRYYSKKYAINIEKNSAFKFDLFFI